ncbi:SRPBCC domain-containing protein [Rhodobacteraceae bacterium 2CG4]|uniref:SRPBCC domain-containing protein n=1 Tax=Halovulum marinum TaxID=2662447 RepID=A0A6L5Z0Z0_9RHOB|nr:SRPBCC domain-containing protein [Halovulum marinum]MSU89760.1 SRPBCC domain-containing protein [Halovulum marinum]
MSDLTLTRFFRADRTRVFDHLTRTKLLLEWWGPEGLTVPVHALDFSRPGPWFSEMHAPDGAVYKVSGQVEHVDPPASVAFTWGWHDDAGQRGPESHVRFELHARDGGTELVLTHSGLADDAVAARHTEGWTSSLGKLERRLAAPPAA